ncbi:sterile alpha motif domain-containing protein 9-like [Embiotoca jacksoni]|uniref:sterile alpha motif domain-containing protein 9-like n=1 Tax=Embiotoca jacksoni TaxID=100190 RepID=UPI003704B507
MADQGDMKEEDMSRDIKEWTKHQVRKWVLTLNGVDDTVAEKLFQQDISGESLLLLDETHLKDMGVTFGPAILIINARKEVVKFRVEEPKSSTNQPGKSSKPYPFCRQHDTFRYIQNDILDVPESGASNLIEPCHEYKGFTNTTDETKLTKFTKEAIRFAAACMNSRTNGTIHFGIGDKPEGFIHGQVLGVVVEDKEAYGNELKSAIDFHFDHKNKEAAQRCIKPPRFVEVLNKDSTSSDKCVIEVDVVPDFTICEENFYHSYNLGMKKGKKKSNVKDPESQPSKNFFIRDGSSSKNLLDSSVEYKHFVDNMAQRSEIRKKAEEKHLTGIKRSTQGSRLSHMITGGSSSFDKSNVEQIVIVTNKSHSSQFEYLHFLVELNPAAVLDFDPESAQHGLQYQFDQQSTVSAHLPAKYKITEGVEDIAKKLELTRKTSWVFCNGGIEFEAPVENDLWLMDKGASVRDVISFLCRKDVLPHKRFLVIFLLLSRVSDRMDPLVETFSIFWQELKGTDQILCICDNEQAFTSWKDLINVRCGINISGRCIYELSFPEVNGTILSLWSKNRRSSRFLPCGGGSKVLLEKKMERSLNALDVLCLNQCEGGNEDKIAIEEKFYKGGKVSWWNFYFAEQPGSIPFIKRDQFDYIMNTLIPDLCSMKKASMLLNLKHITGCGGTTLAKHTLWALRDRFRCAVLKNSNADFAEVAGQVVKLLTFDSEEKRPKVPVLLMIDDCDDMEKVLDLQRLIEKECVRKDIQSLSAQVILLNCMRSDSDQTDSDQTDSETIADTVFIGNKLSAMEQKMFMEKLVEIEKTHKNADTFYGFMILKSNFESKYIQRIVCNTLKSFNMDEKQAQLLAVLALLNVYGKGACLSVSLCEEFLDLKPKPFFGTNKVEDGFGKFSSFIASCQIEGEVVYEAVKIIHPSIAKQCLKELKETHCVMKAQITDLLLITNKFYESTQGKSNLLQDVHQILVKRYHSEEESRFSPLIQDIESETPELVEMVLNNASKRYEKDAIVTQLLARYYCLKKMEYPEAKCWAEKAKGLSVDNSYIADTSAQVIKHELKNAIAKNKEDPISPQNLGTFLKLAKSAIEAFKETQSLAKKESNQRLNIQRDNTLFNTSGCLGEIQVGVLVIDMLEKTPVFSFNGVRHDLMSQVLSGDVQLQDVEKKDPRPNKSRSYYVILRQFEELLSHLRPAMKGNFDFLEKFSVNLSFRFGTKDSREQHTLNELSRCFRVYADLFCKTDSAFLLKNKTLSVHFKLHQMKQFLEKEKADTYSGLLNRLSSHGSPEMMEKIVRHYDFVCAPGHNSTPKERINLIYANVVLSCIKLESQHFYPYQKLIYLLGQVLQEQIPLTESLPLYFIAVLLLWPHLYGSTECRNLGRYISMMKASYHTTMKEVYNGKSPVVHFLLGKKPGYGQLVPNGELKRCIKAGQEVFASMWRNGKIWKHKRVQELLCRVTGEVKSNCILADTCFPHLKFEVAPMYRSQISGHAEWARVSFFIGFSMRGPLALDIELIT